MGSNHTPIYPPALEAAAETILGEQDTIARIRGLRILLVEDSEFNQMIAEEILTEQAGMVVTIAGNGQEALDMLASHSFDLVLMDVQMPILDGYQATKAIRDNPKWTNLPIIAMTGHTLPQDKMACFRVGMNDHISKPVGANELFTTLAKWAGTV